MPETFSVGFVIYFHSCGIHQYANLHIQGTHNKLYTYNQAVCHSLSWYTQVCPYVSIFIKLGTELCFHFLRNLNCVFTKATSLEIHSNSVTTNSWNMFCPCVKKIYVPLATPAIKNTLISNTYNSKKKQKETKQNKRISKKESTLCWILPVNKDSVE